jgi:alkylated DNA repair dioxygenase AlkB
MNTSSLLDNRLILHHRYFSPERSLEIFLTLRQETKWLQAGYLNEDGRTTFLPRLTANYGEESYDYSGLSFDPKPWTPLLSHLKDLATQETRTTFNALIVQLYRDGSDVVHWHADDSPRVGPNPCIVSMSFGATRTFEVKHKERSEERLSVLLEDGDLLIMQGDLQHQYLHRVRKEPQPSARINLTFRHIAHPNAPVSVSPSKTPKTIFREVDLSH